jgi:hypothetical protein
MFREGQAIVKDVQKTANEVKAIGKEVKGIFGWIASLFAEPQATPEQVVQPKKKKKKQAEEFDAPAIYAEIGKQITAFFKAYNTLKDHIEEEEKRSKTVYDPTGDQTEKAVQRVLALSQMEEMQVELREYMIYHVPPELKDLYTRVNKMIGTIANEQAMAKQALFKRRREIEAKERELAEKIWFRTASTIAVIFVAIYLVSLMWLIKMIGPM